MFNDLIKQKQPFASRFLEAALAPGRERLANAYIFTGNNAQDMLFLATETARTLNCKVKTPECTCVSCSWIKQNAHPAVIDVSPEKTVVTIDQARELKRNLHISSPYHRVIIFPKADYRILHSEPANALLKLIEEPPARVTFFFFAGDREDMLETIVSRAQIIPFRYTPDEVSDFSLIEGFPPRSREEALLYTENLLKSDIPPEEILETLQQYLVHQIRQNRNDKNLCIETVNFLKNTQKAIVELRSYVNPQAVLDSLFNLPERNN